MKGLWLNFKIKIYYIAFRKSKKIFCLSIEDFTRKHGGLTISSVCLVFPQKISEDFTKEIYKKNQSLIKI